MKAARLAVLAALLAQTGLPYALGQAYAWARMVGSGQSVAEAVQGEKPCVLCLRIRAAKSATPALGIGAGAAPLDWQAPSARAFAVAEVSAPAASPLFRAARSFDRSLDPPPPRSPLS